MQQQNASGMILMGVGLLLLGGFIGWQLGVAGWGAMAEEDEETLEEVIERATSTETAGGTTGGSAVPSAGGGTTGTASAPKPSSGGTTGGASSGAGSALTVRYTDQGFVPSILEINAGQVVTFVNQSNRTMWVKSTSRVPPYLSLDQGTTLGKGGTWSFTFTSLGTWGFQNDNFRDHKGAVAVMPQM